MNAITLFRYFKQQQAQYLVSFSFLKYNDGVMSCLVYPMLPVSLDCPFLKTPSVFSNVYLVYSIWKLPILIGWLVCTIFEQCMINIGNGWLYLVTGTIPVWDDFPRALYLWNIFSRVICIYFGKIKPPLIQHEILCTEPIIASPSGTVFRWLRHYTSPGNTIGKQFHQEKRKIMIN